MLPPYEGKTVVAIGEGILDFTNQVSDKAGEVLAVQLNGSVTNEVNLVLYNKFVASVCVNK